MDRRCSELSEVISRIALNIGSDPRIRNLDDVAAEMARVIPEINRGEIVKALVELSESNTRAMSDLGKRLGDLRREARSDLALRQQIGTLERHLQSGTLPEGAPGAPEPSQTIAALRAIRDGLRKEVQGSEPAVRKRLLAQIEDLTRRMEAGPVEPPRKLPAPMSKELERLAYERDRLRGQIRARIDSLKPKTLWGRVGGTVGDVMNTARAIMTSFDFSAVLRQGGFITLGHPIRASKELGPMFRAFTSEKAMHGINAEILSRANAPLYARSKLYLAEVDVAGRLNAQEEAFMSRLAKRIPFVRASERAYVTFLNRIRADSFDAMTAALGRNGEVTQIEADAIANYINVATGRGNLWKAENAAQGLNTIFFAPRYVASRFQLLAGQPLYGGTAATRKLIAQEYARYLIGVGVVYGIGTAAGAEIEADPRSSDFGKLRFGTTRLDPLSGLAQVATLAGRTVTGETKSATSGRVTAIRGEGARYGQRWDDFAKRFGRSKLAPVPATIADLTTGENVVGEDVTPASAAARLVTPLAASDVTEAIKEQGVPEGAALGLVSLFGAGLQTYDSPARRGAGSRER